MLRTFRAEKMLKRIEKNSEAMKYLDDEMRELILKLDGKQGNDYNWESVVMGNPLVWIEADEDTSGTYVALVDCD